MRRLLTLTVVACGAIALSVGPATAHVEGPEHHPAALRLAKRACQAEAKASPVRFLARYGPRHGALRRCVRAKLAPAAKAVRRAKHACRAEARANPIRFLALYGPRHGALRRCVRAKLAPVAKIHEAKRTCRAERRADPEAFVEKYGNEVGGRAFPRCVAWQLANA